MFCNSSFSDSTMSNTFFVHLSRWSVSSKFSFKEHALIWNKARDLCLLENFKIWILVNVIVFGVNNIYRLIVFFEEVLLNWLYKRAKSERGFSESKLSSLLVPCWEREREKERETERDRERQRETERDRETERERQIERDRETERDRERVWYGRDEVLFCYCSKMNNFTATRKNNTGLIWALEIFLVNVIKLITFYMNLWLTSITLSCRTFIINVYVANFAGADNIISIFRDTHNVNTDKKMFR